MPLAIKSNTQTNQKVFRSIKTRLWKNQFSMLDVLLFFFFFFGFFVCFKPSQRQGSTPESQTWQVENNQDWKEMPEQAECQNKKQARKHNCLYIFLNFGQCSFYTSQKKLRAKKKGSISFHFLEALGKRYRTGKKERNGQGKGKSFVRGCEEGRLVPSPVFYIAGHPPTGQSNFYRVIT